MPFAHVYQVDFTVVQTQQFVHALSFEMNEHTQFGIYLCAGIWKSQFNSAANKLTPTTTEITLVTSLKFAAH